MLQILSMFTLFIWNDFILCLYVDDAILYSRIVAVLTIVLAAIQEAGYAYSHDKTFSSYLGVLVEHLPNMTKKLSC